MKVTITGGNVSPSKITEIASQALMEIMVSDLPYGAACGQHSLQRYMEPGTGDLEWADTYIYRINKDNVFVDVRRAPEETIWNTPVGAAATDPQSAMQHAQDI